MDFLATDKIFCHVQKSFVQDNLGFVLDKKYFVRAEGRGIIISQQRTSFEQRQQMDQSTFYVCLI